MKFMEFLGISGIPFARIFTKSDKISEKELEKSISFYNDAMSETWESLPPTFTSSAVSKKGREEILDYIEELVNNFSTSARV